ncbi:hypothetical protein BC831DRAFT_484140 [Entophlyctis helioformis]|nr:hypothetical protein BC831DRAFT_484140 [Entophlyctis helioformis]
MARTGTDGDMTTMSDDVETFDLVIVGAGPCSLAILNQLAYRHPAWFSPCPSSDATSDAPVCGMRQPRIAVIDKDGEWLSNWDRLFTGLGIESLRSPAVFHADMADPDSLLHYATERARGNEMQPLGDMMTANMKRGRKIDGQRIKGFQFTPPDIPRYAIPSSRLFMDHARHLVATNRLDRFIRRGTCTGIHALAKPAVQGFRLTFSDRRDMVGATVVVAVGGTNLPRVPAVFGQVMHSGLVRHAFEVWRQTDTAGDGSTLGSAVRKAAGKAGGKTKTKTKRCPASPGRLSVPTSLALPAPAIGRRVLVVGGGITAAQLAINACKDTSVDDVVLVTRRKLVERHFDVPLEWVGRWRGVMLSKFHQLSDPADRWKAICDVRGGGSIPCRYMVQLQSLVRDGRLTIIEHATIESASLVSPSMLSVSISTPDSPPYTEVFTAVHLGTGSDLDISRERLLQPLLASHPITAVDGRVPTLTHCLRWNHHIPLHVVGCYACLQLGPGAFNISGARSGCDRVVPSLEAFLARRLAAKCGRRRGSVIGAAASAAAEADVFVDDQEDEDGAAMAQMQMQHADEDGIVPREPEYLGKARRHVGQGGSLYQLLADLDVGDE